MNKTFYSYSFGCRVNQAELEKFNRDLINTGFEYDETSPSIYIINTCAVTEKAEKEVKKLMRQIKKNIPTTKIIITGCAATKWKKENKKIGGCDLLIENREKDHIVDLILRNMFVHPGSGFTLPPKDTSYFLNSKYLNSKRSILKIQDGCNRFCTYCIVPHLRGSPTSINLCTIVHEIKEIEKDINEVILTAVNTEAYGLDNSETLIDLIDKILKKTNIKRVSFGSINPWSINHEFIQYYRTIHGDNRFVDYFHIPIQSASDKILNLMRRDYTRADLKEKFNSLYKINPFILFGTDVICGFLEETDRDFEDTYNFLKDSPIAKFHVFRFSLRPNTKAYFLSKTLKEPTDSTKIARSKALIELGNKKYSQFQYKLIGNTFKAMFINECKNGFQPALLQNQMPILVQTPKDLLYEIKNVKILELRKEILIGEVV